MATPTVNVEIESGYSSNLVVVRQLEEYLDILDIEEYPLLRTIGLNSYDREIHNTKVEWQLDYLIPYEDALDGAVATTGETVFTVDHAEYFQLHDVVKVEDELVRVVAIDPDDDEITVERGFAGSTAATHSDGDVLTRLGPARPEGSAPGWPQQTTAAQIYNYTQIFDAVAEVTGTEEQVERYGPDALLDTRIDKRMRELYLLMENAVIHGLRSEPTNNRGRTMGGLYEFITDTDDLGSDALVFSDIEDAMENIAGRVGRNNTPNILFANSWPMRKISSWGESSIRTSRTESVYGNVIDSLVTQFGRLQLQYDHLMPTDEVFLLAMDRIAMAPLRGRGFASYQQAVNTTLEDSRRERIIGEYTLVVKGEDGSNDGVHCLIQNISTTS
jgi:hypothetical protein